MVVTDPVRVLVADDQTLFRNVLSRMLEADPRVHVVGQARDGEEAVKQAREGKPNVVLMDLQMPRLNGAEATRRVIQDSSEVRVFALSAYADAAMVDEAMANGAVGFIEKDVTFDEILARILDGGSRDDRRTQRPTGVLTEREAQALMRVADGLSNKQIARRLGLSEKTVRNHLSRAFGKLGVTNRTEAAMTALRLGLLSA